MSEVVPNDNRSTETPPPTTHVTETSSVTGSLKRKADPESGPVTASPDKKVKPETNHETDEEKVRSAIEEVAKCDPKILAAVALAARALLNNLGPGNIYDAYDDDDSDQGVDADMYDENAIKAIVRPFSTLPRRIQKNPALFLSFIGTPSVVTNETMGFAELLSGKK